MTRAVAEKEAGALLAAEIAAFINGSMERDEPAEATFDHLARRLFARQYAHNAPYRTFCEGRGVSPKNVAGWRDVPAVPAAAFKRFALTCAPEAACQPEQGGRVFFSSGTTSVETSRHFLDRAALDLYRASLRAGYRRFVLPDGARPPVLALMTPAPPAPNTGGARGGDTAGAGGDTPAPPLLGAGGAGVIRARTGGRAPSESTKRR